MLNRVRNLKDNFMYMFFNVCDFSYPTTNDELDKSIILQYISSHLLQTKYGLDHSPVFECFKEDIWYQIYRDFIKREDMSKNNSGGLIECYETFTRLTEEKKRLKEKFDK